jgi:hypothetical protein
LGWPCKEIESEMVEKWTATNEKKNYINFRLKYYFRSCKFVIFLF